MRFFKETKPDIKKSAYSITNWMLLELREYFKPIFQLQMWYPLSQIRRGTSGGHAIQHVAVITFTDAVVIIIGAFRYVYAVESYIVIAFTIVHRDMGIVGTPFNAV